MKQLIFAGLFACLCALPAAAQNMFVEQDMVRWGGDYLSFPVETGGSAACGAECARDPECLAWTFARPGAEGVQGVCHLKATVPHANSSSCCESGVMVGTGEETRPRSAGVSRAPENANASYRTSP